ncbi:MAG: penicillin-binding protein activator [Candidatus Aenigmarchaeota archaeon]|nr:penicillin-binding protein activator [Candidatus Aenigmarchaeota archaeon]MDI6722572.1 penicillin-binding protein activator [Candidatus Aenigmarchaeota archaeon]
MKANLISGIIAVIIVAAVIVYFMQPTGQVTAKKEVKVGAILWLTGDYGAFGKAMQRGIEIAADELNQKGDINYKVIFEDEGTIDVLKAVKISRKFVDIDNIDIVLAPAANEGKSISPIFESSKVPAIILFDSNNEIAKGNYMFGIGFSTEGAAKSIAEFAYKNLSTRTVSVIYTYDDWSQFIANGFKKEFEALGGKVIRFEGTNAEEKDFRTFITKSRDSDAIYAPLLFPNLMIKQSRELAYSGYMLSADALDQNQINAAGGAANGVYNTAVYVPGNEKLRKLARKLPSVANFLTAR